MDLTREYRRVSYHAVTRWVQRIAKVTVETPDHWEPKHVARAHAEAIGLTIGEVKAAILSPGVLLAIAAGLPQVATRQFRAAISQPTGIVTTITEPYPHARRRFVVRSDRELRKAAQRAARRARKRPVLDSEAP